MNWFKSNWQSVLIAITCGSVIINIYQTKNTEPVDGSYYIKQQQMEFETLKSEINEMLQNLEIRYERIDTITTSSGANAYVDEFIIRSGGHYPPTHR